LDEEHAAKTAKIGAELRQARHELERARERRASDVRSAEAKLLLANRNLTRLKQLFTKAAVPESDVERAELVQSDADEALTKAELPLDQGRIEILNRTLALAEKEYNLRAEELAVKMEAKKGEAVAAQLELANLELERRQSELIAPRDGVVIAGEVKVGEILEKGRPVIEIAEDEGFIFEAIVPSEEVGHLRTALPTKLKLDAFDYHVYGTVDGIVTFLSPDSARESTGEKRKTTYLVKIKLLQQELKRGKHRGQVKLGMAGTAEIVTERRSLLAILVRGIRRSISLG
jgi:multidrug resistance efflux pump